MALLKHRVAIQVVRLVTVTAPIHRQLTLLRGAKLTRFTHTRPAAGATQFALVKVLYDPVDAFFAV